MKHQAQALLGDTPGKIAKPGNHTLICERPGKSLYQSDKPNLVIQAFRSNGADDSKKRAKPSGLAALRNQISSYLFEYLEGFHIPTHFISTFSPNEMLVRWMDVIPLTVKVYNGTNREVARRLGMHETTPLEFPIIEHYYTNGVSGSSWVNEFHVYALAIATPDEFKQVNRIASKANAVLRGLCERRQLMLTEIQMEFGRYEGQIMLGDEISPLTCRFLDLAVQDPAQQDRFRLDQENAESALAQLCDRLMMKV